MKIAILYICTGKYEIFWKDFYLSAEKYFFKDVEKDYIVFTDAEKIYDEEKENIKKMYQEKLKWPEIALFRYKIFSRITKTISEYDYVFFFNANALFVDYVGKEILTSKDELIVINHPGFYNKKRKYYTYDNNINSLAYIGPNEGEIYAFGAFSGGKSSVYIKMITDLEKKIDIDYEKGIIALWHDESHLNRYVIDNERKVLGPEYMWFEGKKAPFPIKIIVRDKDQYGGHHYLRGQKTPLKKKIKLVLKKVKYGLRRKLNNEL